MKRRVEAVMSMFTDMIGLQTNKARALSAGEQQGHRAVVNSLKPTGGSALTPSPVTSPTHPSDRTHEAGKHIVASFTRQRKNGADNEYSAIRRAADSAQARNDLATRSYAIQTARHPRRKDAKTALVKLAFVQPFPSFRGEPSLVVSGNPHNE